MKAMPKAASSGGTQSFLMGCVMQLLSELHQEGATICIVTHDPIFAAYADRTVNVFDGRILEETEHDSVHMSNTHVRTNDSPDGSIRGARSYAGSIAASD